MRLIEGMSNAHAMLQMYKICMSGPAIESRGMPVRNVPNMAIVFNAVESMLTDFVHRNLNVNYCKREWLWYLGADPKDASIQEHAKMWAKLQQPDGTFFSNYGQYMFARGDTEGGLSQFEYVIQQLKKDPNSRRASMVLLQRQHLFDENADTVCTYAINFSIHHGYLDMTVMMRSNDVVFGFTNDAFCFWQLQQFVYAVLSKTMPALKLGQYTHITNSMHVYERHFDMLKKILADGSRKVVKVPQPTGEEAIELFKTRGQGGDGEYTTWLKTVD